MHIPEICLTRLCDPDMFSAEEAVQAAQSISRLLPGLDVDLEDRIARNSGGLGADPRARKRAIQIVNSISQKRAKPAVERGRPGLSLRNLPLRKPY